MMLFIPGLFSKPVSALLGGYFADQIQLLEEVNRPYETISIHSEQTITQNANVIADSIGKHRQATVVAHSKGGVDLLEALIRYPKITKHIKKILFLQAPFYGTPAINFMQQNLPLKLTMKSACRLLKGNYQTLTELNLEKRKKYMSQNLSAINEITKKIETTCVGTYMEKTQHDKMKSLLFPTIHYMGKRGYKTDGLVPMKSSLLPGSTNIILKGIDHATLVLRRTMVEFDRKSFTTYLLNQKLEPGRYEFQYGKGPTLQRRSVEKRA